MWVSTDELRDNAFRMLYSAMLVKKLFPDCEKELVNCLHSNKSKPLLVNLLLSSEEKLDRIPSEANEAFSLMLEEVFTERVITFIHGQVGTDANALVDIANGSFYSSRMTCMSFLRKFWLIS